MKIEKIIIFVSICIFSIVTTVAQEIDFISSDIKITDNGNILKAADVIVKVPKKNLIAESDKAKYNKKTKLIIFESNVKIQDLSKNLILHP